VIFKSERCNRVLDKVYGNAIAEQIMWLKARVEEVVQFQRERWEKFQELVANSEAIFESIRQGSLVESVADQYGVPPLWIHELGRAHDEA
jgi:hypothetical protein